MGAFDRLKKNLESQEEKGCETSSEAKDFVRDHGERVEKAERSMKERQNRDRNQQD
jgi:hypothetical protein